MILNIADTGKVSPLAQNKKGLDRDMIRSSVFVADMTYIALRSKIQSERMIQVWFGFFCSTLDCEDVLVHSVR